MKVTKRINITGDLETLAKVKDALCILNLDKDANIHINNATMTIEVQDGE